MTAWLLAVSGLLNAVLVAAAVAAVRRARRGAAEVKSARRELEQAWVEVADRRRQEAFYRNILEEIPEMICRWSPDGRISYVNDAYCRYFGLSREALLDRPGFAFFHTAGGGRDGVADPAVDREQPVTVVEFSTEWPDGSVRWQRWLDRALFDEDGAIREFQSIGTDITDQRRAEEERARLSEENRRLARMALAVQEQERANLARELHDELGQSLTAIRAEAECIRRVNRDADATIAASAAAIDSVAGRFYTVVRGMMHRLRPELLDDLGLAAALRELIGEWQRRHPGVEAAIAVDELPPLDRDVELAAWRIVQEALTNIARHAGATQVEVAAKVSMRRRHRGVGAPVQGRRESVPGGLAVAVQATDTLSGRPHPPVPPPHRDCLELRVRDNGCGMDVHAADPGFGLLGMRERALTFGGEFEVISTPGNGATIRALLPSTAPEEETDRHG